MRVPATPRFSKVILICPEFVTGGPEAIHQLSHSINSFGGYSRILYTNSKYVLTSSEATGNLSADSVINIAYREYDPQPVTAEQLTEDTLLIFPEMWIDWCFIFSRTTKARCACWWLSVDNAETHKRFKDPNMRAEFFIKVFHFSQSEYAYDFLTRTGAPEVYKMTDYTNRLFTDRGVVERSLNRRAPRSVAYFPSKGRDLFSLFQQKLKEIDFPIVLRPIENMSRSQVINLLASSEVYIDFGHQPGKDRVPREAAALGCVVLLNRVGSAAFFADHPLPSEYKFSREDIQVR